MAKKSLIINLLIIALILIITSFILGKNIFKEDPPQAEKCEDINNLQSFLFDICYDAYSKNVFIEIKRTRDNYKINNITLSYKDEYEQQIQITAPSVNQTRNFKLPVSKNPDKLNIVLEQTDVKSCREPRILYIRYCDIEKRKEIETELKKSTEETIYKEITPGKTSTSDFFTPDLVDKERIWQNTCASSWQCSEWESCENNIQRRNCIDTNNCAIPTNTPDFTRFCDTTCSENWQCTWSSCIDGFSVPDCSDLNKCGTQYSRPSAITCDTKKTCTPSIECQQWSECKTEYNFVNLAENKIDFTGLKSRLCTDKNKCTSPVYEEQSCSVKMDIYTKRISKCGKDYIAIFNKLNNVLMAQIEEDSNNLFNIQMSASGEEIYCEHCYNGVLDQDEEQIDCGGSCPKCETPYQRKLSILERVLKFFRV